MDTATLAGLEAEISQARTRAGRARRQVSRWAGRLMAEDATAAAIVLRIAAARRNAALNAGEDVSGVPLRDWAVQVAAEHDICRDAIDAALGGLPAETGAVA